MPCRLSKEAFDQIIREALLRLPERYLPALEYVRVEVRDRPTRAMRKSLGISADEVLLGLYEGRPLTERSVDDSGTLPEVIYLFKQEIEEVCEGEEEVREEVWTTLLHEFGHHFGLDEGNLDELGYG